jgi:nitrate reductase (cytochrome), electron transfer subunit
MSTPARKLALLALIAALTTGASGYFMGLLQAERSADRRKEPGPKSTSAHRPASLAQALTPEAPLYTQLRERTHQPNHGWHSSLKSLPPAPAFSASTPALSADALALLRAKRDERRAYNGAPPTVPHPIDQYQSTACLACHGTPTRIGAIDVPQISHPAFTQCIQCHAPQQGPGPSLARPERSLATPALANAFTGLPPPAGGSRAYADAPPVMPHGTHMRQNCVSCHGPGGSSALKTTHPQRQNCLQCHPTDATRETLPPAFVTKF